MRRHAPPKRITRSLRFRLTAAYALFFSFLLIVMGAIFRQTMASALDSQIRDGLEQEWAASKGYLRIEKGNPVWYWDHADPDEDLIVRRIQHVYALTDAHGHVWHDECSGTYRSLGIDSPAEIAAILRSGQPGWRIRSTPDGTPYLIRSGLVWDEEHREQYFLAIGRSLADNRHILERFTFRLIGLVPLMILSGCVLGWYLAGRALMPVISVAQAAQRISGSNLSLRIPTREAGDELDYLIETFNQMIGRLEHSFNQIRQFSTDVSHELRTPITAIRGQLEVALFTARTTEQYRDAMLNALQDIERLSQIVRALLLLSQAESGQLALQKTAVDMRSLLADVVDQFQIPAEAAHVRLQADLPPECWFEADRIQIERMVSNLLSNAMKFTPAGGSVRASLECRGDTIRLTIEDTGCGIAPEHLPHIFDRFYRVSSPDAPEKGLGLGLSFVAWIVKVHGGSIDVRSTPGQGTTFTILLPVGSVTRPPHERTLIAVEGADG